MQEAIAEAVGKVKAASEKDKAEALQAMEAELNARHEALSMSMISRLDMEEIMGEAIYALDGPEEAAKEAALDASVAKLRSTCAARAANGGRLGKSDALRLISEVLEDWDAK